MRNGKAKFNILLIVVIVIIICSCGEGSVEIGPNTYEPKIVIEGYLYPGKKFRRLKLLVTFRSIQKLIQLLPVANSSDVKLVDLQSSKEYKLTFNSQKFSFEYNGTDLSIGFDKSYQLVVTAIVDGKVITANSTTHIPKVVLK